jgi:hypothetical protein
MGSPHLGTGCPSYFSTAKLGGALFLNLYIFGMPPPIHCMLKLRLPGGDRVGLLFPYGVCSGPAMVLLL